MKRMVWSERRRESERKRDGANDKIMLFYAFHGSLFINHVPFFLVLAAEVLWYMPLEFSLCDVM